MRYPSAQIGREGGDNHFRARRKRIVRKLRTALLYRQGNRAGRGPYRGFSRVFARKIQHRRARYVRSHRN